MQVSEVVDQEFALTCLRLHRRMRNFAVVVEKLPPGTDVFLTARLQPASSRTFLTSDSLWLVPQALRILVSANEGGQEDSDVVSTVSRALRSTLLAPILLVFGDGVLLCFS